MQKICPECDVVFEKKRNKKDICCSMACRDGIKHRFFPQVIKTETCWNWNGLKDRNGYGTFVKTINGKKEQRAHRVSWIYHNGPIPEGKIVCHRCDNPSCVNPAHLFVGTWDDNMQDKTRKGRNNPPVGSRAGAAILTEAKVVELRNKHATGEFTQRALALEYGVGFKAINKIIHRQRWAHV
jgi:hypothetical protein